MPRKRDNETGRYKQTYSTDQFLEALEALNGAAGTKEVADKVGCAYRTAHAKLSKLEEEGQITTQKVGKAFLWQLDVDE